MSWAIIPVAAAFAAEATPPPGTDTLTVLLAALLASGVLTTLIITYRDRHIGPVRMKEMEEHIADLAVSKLEKALVQSEKDLAKATARIEQAEQQISTLTLRIVQLESELAIANTDRDELRRHLAEAETERADLITQVEVLEKRIGGRRRDDDPRGGS